jgi:sugar-specific transcriptional regulator TrmB
MVIDLLQQVGLNKYEAEAYAALLLHGPLTGYELGKRSGVPLSRSYEILERLTVKGLALVQPGDPPRYAAEAPEQFVGRTRAATTATLDALAAALAELGQHGLPAGFWVVRGQEQVLAHMRSYIARAERTLAVLVAGKHAPALAEALAGARGRGCRVVQVPGDPRAEAAALALLVADEREGLVGTLDPGQRAQAVASANPGFLAVLARYITPQPAVNRERAAAAEPARATPPLDWLDWEQRKQRQLLGARPGSPAA